MVEAIPKAYKPWLIVSLVVLVGSLLGLVVVGSVAFVLYANAPTPLWIILLGVATAGGVGLGFAGFLGLMLFAGWQSFREGRRVRVIPPVHGD